MITGANGCVGYELIRTLHQAYKIIAVDLNKDNLEDFSADLDFYRIDIGDREALERVFNGCDIDYVIHLAAKVHSMPKGNDGQAQFYKINVQATENLFKFCLEKKVKRVVFFSTIAVYGDQGVALNETSQPKPMTIYAKTKYQAEQIGLDLVEKQGLPLYIFRPATIYGRYDRGNYKRLFALARKRINVILGDGDNYKPIVYVKDVVGAVKSLLRSEGLRPGEIFNICEHNYRYKEILAIVNEVFAVKPWRIKIPQWITDGWLAKAGIFAKLKTLSTCITVDNSKMQAVLKYKPKYDLRSGLEDAKEYYL